MKAEFFSSPVMFGGIIYAFNYRICFFKDIYSEKITLHVDRYNITC